MMVVNAMANYLPINDLTTGAVSALYPNKFVPDGFTFSIWSVIYLWLLLFVGYTNSVLIWLPGVDHRYHRIVSILPLFWLTCLLNALWILSWHYLQVILSLLLMIGLLFCLVKIYARLGKHPAHPRKRDHMLVEVPFIIYLGWISVATIANTTALLVDLGWRGAPLGEGTWAIIALGIATALGVWMSLIHHRPSYSLVLCWAFWGIHRAQAADDASIGLASLIAIATCLGFAIPELLRPRRGWKPAA